MTYDEIKTALVVIAKQAYMGDTGLDDIRAALHAADLQVEMWAAYESAANIKMIAAALKKEEEYMECTSES